jgi:hypothetical protein
MIVLYLILFVFAFVCLILATFNVPSRINLVALALAFCVAVWLLQIIFGGELNAN